MTSTYLKHPLLPLTVTLPLLLEKIEAELANEKLLAAQKHHLRTRADLIRSLLGPGPVT